MSAMTVNHGMGFVKPVLLMSIVTMLLVGTFAFLQWARPHHAELQEQAALSNTVRQATIVQAHQVTTPQWLAGKQVQIPPGMIINLHAAKHIGQKLDAWKLYDLLLTGHCVASWKWQYCGKDLYVCQDPITGLIGGLFVIRNEIISGFASPEGYWYDRVTEGQLEDLICGNKYAIH